EAVRVLDTHRTPIQKQPEALLCLVGISRRYYIGDDVYGSIRLDSCSQSNKGEDRESSACSSQLPLLTLTASRVIEMDEPAAATDSSGVPLAIEKSPLDFAEAEASGKETAAPEMSSQGVAVAEGPGSENASSPIEVLSPGGVYWPEWGVTNGSLLDTPEACQDLVDHAAPPGYFAELRHMFEQEAKLLKKSVAQVARREKRIQDRELEIKNLE
nr:hypothetical protein [Tanacetum cinerariifolium]